MSSGSPFPAAAEIQHKRIFDGDDGCPFKDCAHWQNCSGSLITRGTGKYPVYMPEIVIEHQVDQSAQTLTGRTGGKAFVVCNDYKEKAHGLQTH